MLSNIKKLHLYQFYDIPLWFIIAVLSENYIGSVLMNDLIKFFAEKYDLAFLMSSFVTGQSLSILRRTIP